MKKIGYILLFATLLILLVGSVNATEVSDNSTISTIDATQVVDDTRAVSFKDAVLEDNNANYLINDDSSKYVNDNKDIKRISTDDADVKEDSIVVSSWEELYDAVDAKKSATTDTTIVLGEGTYTTVNVIVWNNTGIVLSIEGNGQTIDGNVNQVFDVTAGSSLILKDITIRNAKFDYGGAIINEGNLTVINSTFNDNEATWGAAVYNTGKLTVIDSTFENNAALKIGGAICSISGPLTVNGSRFINNRVTTAKDAFLNDYGGGAILSSGPLSIDNSVFEANVAAYDDSGSEDDGGVGGAVLVYNFTDDVSITNSNFTNNEASGAGAISVYDPQYRDEGMVLIDSNNFIENIANQAGAVILQHSAIVTNNNFTENMIDDKNICIEPYAAAIDIYDDKGEKTYAVTLRDNTFNGNDAGNRGMGGAISIAEGMLLDSSNNLYENNRAGYGGAIFNEGNSTFDDDIFTDNTALYQGGAIFSNNTLTVTGSKFTNNRVTTSKDASINDYGGGAIISSGPLSIDNSLFTSNIAPHNDSGEIMDTGVGGAVYVYNCSDDVSITNSNFTDNRGGNGGVITVYDPQHRDEGRVLIDSNNFIENIAYQCGAISLQHSAIVTNNNFTDNMLDDNTNVENLGGAISIYDELNTSTYTLSLSDNRFSGNDAGEEGYGGALNILTNMVLESKNNIYENNRGELGGAICNSGNATFTDDTFTDNTALYQGGAIASNKILTVKGSKFTNNRAAIGGAITNFGYATVNDDTFTDNSATYFGGAIASEQSLTVTGSKFTNNMVTTTKDAAKKNFGGGAILSTGPLSIDNSVFTANIAAHNDSGEAMDAEIGGAVLIISCTDDVSITNSNFTANEAGYGGAICVYDMKYRDEGRVLIDSNNFKENSAYEGGALALQHSAIVTNNNFTENTNNYKNINTSPVAAAIDFYDEKNYNTYTLTLSDNTFRGNDAGKDGYAGALYSSEHMILNSNGNTYENNRAAFGGAVYNQGNATFDNDTFTDNTALYQGGAIASEQSLTVTGSKFTNNRVTTTKDAFLNDYGGGAILSSGPLSIDNSLFEANVAAYDDSGSEDDGGVGGAVLVYNFTDDVSITNSNFTNNEASGAGAIGVYDPQYRDEGRVLIDSNNFIENIANQAGALILHHSAIVTNNNFTENMIDDKNICIESYGAAIDIYDEIGEKTYAVTLRDNTFNGNDAGNRGMGGAISIAEGMLLDSSNNLYENNRAAFGGAVYNLGNSTFDDDIFTDNTALYQGGAIFSNNTLTVTGSKFTNNRVTTSKDASINDYGGGAILSSGPLSIDNSVFTANVAPYDDYGEIMDTGIGGAVYVYNCSDDVSITNSNFTANEAGMGGAMDVYDPQYRDEGNVVIDSNNFIENRAYQSGALTLQHSAIVTNNNFTDNMLDDNTNLENMGGAISLYDELNTSTYILSLSDNTFRGNDAGKYGYGGAICLSEHMILNSNGNTYENNRAYFAGAICNFGNATFNGDVFIQNSATYVGVINNINEELIINNCSFNDNKALEIDLLFTDKNVLIRDSSINTDNLEKLVKPVSGAEIFAYENVVNDEFLDDGLINSSITLTLDGTDLIRNKENIINGSLIDATDVPVFNKTVELYVDGVMEDTAVTDENGVFTFKYVPTGGSNASVQVIFNPDDYYLSCASEAVEVNIVENDTPVPVPPQPKPPVPVQPKVKSINKVATVQNNKNTQAKTHTIRLASDNRIVFTGNALTLEGLNRIFDMNFTNGHLLVYIDGILVFNGTSADDLSLIIIELLDKYLGEHEIKVVFTDGENNTNTYKENIIIE